MSSVFSHKNEAIKLSISGDPVAQKRCVDALVQGGVNANNQCREVINPCSVIRGLKLLVLGT